LPSLAKGEVKKDQEKESVPQGEEQPQPKEEIPIIEEDEDIDVKDIPF